MKILMVSNTYTPIVGGVERSIKSFAAEYKRLGHDVLIVTLEFDNMPEEEVDVIRVPALRRVNGSDFSVRLPIPVNLSSALDNFKPDIIHSHHPFILGDTALRIANKYRVPLVFTYHTKYEDYTHYVPLDSPAMKKFVIELTTGYADLADHVFAPSQSIREQLVKRGVRTPIDVVPTGVEFERFTEGDGKKFRKDHGLGGEDFVIGHVGRLAQEKNLFFLARSVISFFKKDEKAKFLLVGKGPDLEETLKLFARESLEDRVVYTGVLEGQALIDAYHAMDVFAFASKTETQGVVLLEAMAAGVPVVALDATGVNDILKDKYNGRLVMREDQDAFTEALSWLRDQTKEQMAALKKDAQSTAASLSIEKTASQALAIYRELLSKDFVYSDIEQSLWAQATTRIKTEWELISNFAGAVGSALKEPRGERESSNWFNTIQRWCNVNEWSARLLGLSSSEGTETSPGIVFIQIDGLALNQLKHAMKEGRMPFLLKLLKKERYALDPFYSGQPSSTPGVQGELFYGIKGAVPSFSFLNHATNEVFKMYNVDAAIAVEGRLKKQGEALLKEGSSYSNIYSGGAQETHFCAVDLGWDRLWRKIRPVKLLFLGIIQIFSLARTIFRMALELVSSLFDFGGGLLTGRNFLKELNFIPTRIVLCILLRDLITFGAKVDIIRGLPVIHLNFLGYDEHAHRRGPSSRFAHRTLRAIDYCIEKIYTEAFRSQRRNYDVWIYSDHGQEEVLSYVKAHGKSVHQAVKEVFQEFQMELNFQDQDEMMGIQARRAYYLGPWLARKTIPVPIPERSFPKKENLTVTAMGPMGHIYLPRLLSDKEKDTFAGRLVNEAKIPLVLSVEGPDKVRAWNKYGSFLLPGDDALVLGENHPFSKEVVEDLIKTCHHPDAGTFTISGWRWDEKPMSFPIENGAHGGPGREETQGFVLLPADISREIKRAPYLRAVDLHNAALNFMNRQEAVLANTLRETIKAASQKEIIRVLTYNVHGCKGMDGKISPERIARVIGRLAPDIVALQELDMNRLRSGGIDQPHTIARELAMHYHFHPALEVGEGRYGNAILSRFPIELVAAKKLPGLAGKNSRESRGALWVNVTVGEKRIQVINTHLGLNQWERINQVNALLGPEWLAHPQCRGPLILVGDFNSLPSSRVCKRLCQNLRDVQRGRPEYQPQATWFGHLPLTRIDHIFVGPGLEVSYVEVIKTRLDKIASDHLPLLADIKWAG